MSHKQQSLRNHSCYSHCIRKFLTISTISPKLELFDAAEVLDSKRLPRGPRLAVVTSADGPGVMATDALIQLGGQLAELSDESMKQLNAFLPSYWSKANPVDLLGDATVDRFTKAFSRPVKCGSS